MSLKIQKFNKSYSRELGSLKNLDYSNTRINSNSNNSNFHKEKNYPKKSTQDLLSNLVSDDDSIFNRIEDISLLHKKIFSTKERFSIVSQVKYGNSCVEEICVREGIDQETFLNWSKNILNLGSKSFGESKVGSRGYRQHRLLVGKFSNENEKVIDYFENYIDFTDSKILISEKSQNIKAKFDDLKNQIICFEKLNNVRFINKFLEQINANLIENGVFIGNFESLTGRKERLKVKYSKVFNNVFFAIEFLIKRVLPKLSLTKRSYFQLTKGNDRLLSKAEGLGRLVSCGFRIVDYKNIDGLIYFVVRKRGAPLFDMNPSYGPIYKMPRIGKNGKIINVYKLRTMHPYSEYLQDYVLKVNGYSKKGKPENDFRIPVWGKFFRRYWIDEIPQLINVLKGDMKLVGIRPVSKRYFQDIPKEMRILRVSQKPGCIPPYVALNRNADVMSVLQAEKEYLEEKIKNPYYTDLKYFFKAFLNIVFLHKRSA